MHFFQVFAGSDTSLNSALTALDKVNATAFAQVGLLHYAHLSEIHFDIIQAVSTLLKGKPTYVAVGDVNTLPYADELGL